MKTLYNVKLRDKNKRIAVISAYCECEGDVSEAVQTVLETSLLGSNLELISAEKTEAERLYPLLGTSCCVWEFQFNGFFIGLEEVGSSSYYIAWNTSSTQIYASKPLNFFLNHAVFGEYTIHHPDKGDIALLRSAKTKLINAMLRIDVPNKAAVNPEWVLREMQIATNLPWVSALDFVPQLVEATGQMVTPKKLQWMVELPLEPKPCVLQLTCNKGYYNFTVKPL